MLEFSSEPAADTLITLESVSKIYHTAAGDFPALIDFDAIFTPGEFVSVVGKSGSGKSTLVNMITGIDHPSDGLVTINGTRIHELSESRMSSWRGRNLGIIFQFFQLLPNLTLLENVMLPMDFCDRYPFSERETRARTLLAEVELDGKEGMLPSAVSGGEQQRTAIARALANDPPILIADEPTGNLDTSSAENIFGIFHRLVDDGKTIVMVTHDMDLAQRTHRILLLSDGHQVNPEIVNAFNGIPHPRLLWLDRQMSELQLDPGTSLPPNVSRDHGLLLVTDGALDALAPHGSTEPGGRLGPGSLWLRPAEGSQLGELRAAGDEPTRVLILGLEHLKTWLAESPPDQERLNQLLSKQQAARLQPRLRRISP